MKKIVILSLVLLTVVIILCSCGCEHDYSSEIVNEPTCGENGKILYTCSKCDNMYTEEIGKTGEHAYESEKLSEPTCNVEGEIKYTCTVCNDTYTESIPKDDSAHKYTSVVTKEPTCGVDGEAKYTCSVCGKTHTDVVQHTGKHTCTEKITKAATCGEDGVKTLTCTVCGKTYTETIAHTSKHTYTSKVTKAATTTSTGVRTYTCSGCGKTYTETIAKVVTKWEFDYYIDEFKEKTDDAYVRGEFTGTFENSLYKGLSLTTYVYLDKSYNDCVQIRLLEYGNTRITKYSNEYITIRTKDEKGNVTTYNDRDIYFDSSSKDMYIFSSKLAKQIVDNDKLSFVIYVGTYNTYYFSTENEGLDLYYNQT